jgi:hypothetical protein
MVASRTFHILLRSPPDDRFTSPASQTLGCRRHHAFRQGACANDTHDARAATSFDGQGGECQSDDD